MTKKLYSCFHTFIDAEQKPSVAPNHANGTTGWELALVTAPSSNESAAAASKLVVLLLPFLPNISVILHSILN